MAKVTFSKLGLTKHNLEDKIIEFNGQLIEVKQYLPVEDKADLIDEIVNKTISENGFFNPYKLRIVSDFEIVKAYTNISFTEKQSTENFFKTYDLMALEIMPLVFEAIPEQELKEIRKTVWDVAQAISAYNNSVMGMISHIAQDYSNVNFDLDKLQEVLGNPNNLQLVKRMIENV